MARSPWIAVTSEQRRKGLSEAPPGAPAAPVPAPAAAPAVAASAPAVAGTPSLPITATEKVPPGKQPESSFAARFAAGRAQKGAATVAGEQAPGGFAARYAQLRGQASAPPAPLAPPPVAPPSPVAVPRPAPNKTQGIPRAAAGMAAASASEDIDVTAVFRRDPAPASVTQTLGMSASGRVAPPVAPVLPMPPNPAAAPVAPVTPGTPGPALPVIMPGVPPHGVNFGAPDPFVTAGERLAASLLLKREKCREGDTLARIHGRQLALIQRSMGELSLIEGNLRRVKHDLATIYVTSCFGREGKTTAALYTAYGLAETAHRRVLLVDTNGDRPALHTLLDQGHEPGLREVLAGQVELADAIIPTAHGELYFLPAGKGPLVLHEAAGKNLMKILRAAFDMVVLDGKSALSSSTPSNMATLVDAFIIVVECESTKWEVLQLAREKLTTVGAASVAVVLNKRKFYIPRAIYRLLSKR